MQNLERDGNSAARLVVNLLGPWQVTVDGRPVDAFKYDKVRALLAFLVMETDRPHRRERLAGLLWPESTDAAAREGLRQALATLRRAIGDSKTQPPHLLSSRESLAFNLESSYEVDAVHFRNLVEAGRLHGHRQLASCPTCLDRLAQASELYQGDFLAHFSLPGAPEFESWLTSRRAHLHRLALESLATLTKHALRLTDAPAAQEYARRQLVLEPWREVAHRQLMLALAQDGQRTAALAQFEQCREELASALAVEPESETLTLYEQIRLGTVTASRDAYAPLSMAFTYHQPSLVGRENELTHLLELVTRPETRLLTIAGPGGVGKTHLATVLARRARPYFGDGVAFVSLTALEHTGQLSAAMAAAIGLRFQGSRPPERQLVDYLASREMLLLLDNFEHLSGEPTLLSELVNGAPKLVLLVTSRHRLKLRPEQLFSLRGLPYPVEDNQNRGGSGADLNSELEAYGAVQLFVHRVRRVRPDFRLGPDERRPVADICRLAEGVPLMIELAAAMTAERSPAEVVARLAAGSSDASESFYDLPARQRSLAATLDYAWRLLTVAEQQTFSRLSIFRGNFGPLAASAVTGADASQLRALVDKSLLQESSSRKTEADATKRQTKSAKDATIFSLHPLTSRYARQKLADRQQVAGRHAAYFLDLVAAEGPALDALLAEREAAAAATRLGLALNDIRHAWRWAVENGRRDLIASAASGLAAYLAFAGLYQEAEETFGATARAMEDKPVLAAELRLHQASSRQKLGDYQGGLDLLDEVLVLLDAAGTAPNDDELAVLQSRTLILRSHLLELLGAYDDALNQLRLALDTLPNAYQGTERSSALGRMGSIFWRSSQYEEALEVFQEAMELDKAAGRRGRLSRHLGNLGLVYKDIGDYDQALDHLSRALAAAEVQGHREDTARFSLNVGLVYWQTGRLEEADHHYQRALSLARALNHKRGTATSLVNLGVVARLRGSYDAALGYYQEGLALARELGEKALQATLLGNIGNVYMDMGRFEQATDFMHQALLIDRELGNDDGVARHLGNLGDLHKYAADFVTAATYFAESQDLLRKSGGKYYLCWVLIAGAEVALARAENEADALTLLAQAEAMNSEGQALADEIGRREYAFASRVLAGRLLAASGDRPGAVTHLEALLAEVESREEEADVYYALWQIGGQENARAEALILYRAISAEIPKALYRSRLTNLEAE